MSYIHPNDRRFPPLSFAASRGLQPADALPFGDRVRLSPDRVQVRHTTSAGYPLGVETYAQGPNGRSIVRYTPGASKGVLMTGYPRQKSGEVILVEGAMAAIAAAALHPAGLGETIMVVGLGGFWNADVTEELIRLAANARICGVQLAITEHHAAGRRMREQVLSDLDRRISVCPVPAPPGGWIAGLIEARSGSISPGA